MSETRAWGGIWVGEDALGYPEVTLENPFIRCKYGLLISDEEDGTIYETNITEFMIKNEQSNQISSLSREGGDRIDAAAFRGPLSSTQFVPSRQADQENESVTVRMEWSPYRGPSQIQEVTIREDTAYLAIRYLQWFVNIVDMASPGGSRNGEYAIYGAEKWRRPYTFYPQTYFSKAPGDIGEENITEVEDPSPLSYDGWFIMGIYNPGNGLGYGRVMPVYAVDILKLLFKDERLGKRGFELFPGYQREHQPYTGYLFPVVGGSDGVISTGQAIARQANGSNIRR